MATDVKIPAARIASLNPATGEVLREFACASAAEVNAAVARARVAQQSWGRTPVRERVRILRDFQKRLHARKRETSELITDRKSTRLNSSHIQKSRMPSSA